MFNPAAQNIYTQLWCCGLSVEMFPVLFCRSYHHKSCYDFPLPVFVFFPPFSFHMFISPHVLALSLCRLICFVPVVVVCALVFFFVCLFFFAIMLLFHELHPGLYSFLRIFFGLAPARFLLVTLPAVDFFWILHY